MRTVPARFMDGRQPTFITPSNSAMFGFSTLLDNARSTATAAWPSANKPVLIPFRVPRPIVVTHLGWFNGSSAGGNHDIAIYNEAFTRLVSAGSTVGSGNSSWQFVDVTDTALSVGFYYLAKVLDTAVANRSNAYQTTTAASLMNLCGVKESTDNAVPLPDPLANVVDANVFTRLPPVAMLLRAPF